MLYKFLNWINKSTALPKRQNGIRPFVKYKLNQPGFTNFHLLPTAKLNTQPLYVFSPLKKRIAPIGNMQKQLNNLR